MQAAYEAFIAAALRAYKALIGPVFGRRCRYLPTCSEYAAAVLVSHGPVRGSGLALRRLCRCNPLGGSGYDPPPERPRSACPSAGPSAGTCDA